MLGGLFIAEGTNPDISPGCLSTESPGGALARRARLIGGHSAWGGQMGRLLGVVRGPDSAHVALVVGGIAIALGGAALFGIIAHTRTPWSTQRIVGLVPLDSLAPADFVVPLPSVALKAKRPAA